MRGFLIVLVLLLAFLGYIFIAHPRGCERFIANLYNALFGPSVVEAPSPSGPTTNSLTTNSAADLASATPPSPPEPVEPPRPPPVITIATNGAAHIAPKVTGWAPPDPIPEQEHWMWLTTDGKEYDDVVILKLEEKMVTIQSSEGTNDIEVATLSPKIQKMLRYDPNAGDEPAIDLPDFHPYYRLRTLTAAKKMAHDNNLPLAWICAYLADENGPGGEKGDQRELTHFIVDYLQGKAIIIFLDGDEVHQAPDFLTYPQFFQLDDGVLLDGNTFVIPKIVFTDADATKALGRVSHKQLFRSRQHAIDQILQKLAPPKPGPPPL